MPERPSMLLAGRLMGRLAFLLWAWYVIYRWPQVGRGERLWFAPSFLGYMVRNWRAHHGFVHPVMGRAA